MKKIINYVDNMDVRMFLIGAMSLAIFVCEIGGVF